MDRRGHKKGLVRAKKSGTKSGTGALAGLDSTREWPENRVAVMAGPGLGSQYLISVYVSQPRSSMPSHLALALAA